MNKVLSIAGIAWIAVVGLGFAPLLRYAARPSEAGAAPSSMPRPGRATLTMVLHPECPCSRASVRELERLLAHIGDRVDARAIITGRDVEASPIYRLASSIAGLRIERDPTGALAHALDARTSGETYLYGPGGELMFHGGLTAARGHEGQSEAYEVIVSALAHAPTHAINGAVFGCRLETRP